MKNKLEEIVIKMTSEEAKKVLLALCRMHLDEYPLTDKDLDDMLLNSNDYLR